MTKRAYAAAWLGVLVVLGLGSVREAKAQLAKPVVLFDAAADLRTFSLVSDGKPAAVYVDRHDSETVRVVAHAFADDLQRVSGTAPEVKGEVVNGSAVVIVGSVDHSSAIDDLRKRGKIDTREIDGKWEAAITVVVADPFPGVRRALVIAGSDRRGTAFALFTLSRLMGVSPWYWWADVPVPRHRFVSVAAGTYVQQEPSVKYRGIFLNDEDWGLRPWAARNMDSQLKNIGPETYGKICELLLRLHGNLLWPAMHPGSAAFHRVPGNAETADRWGIVMGSSHSEAVLRDNVGEWDRQKDGDWNYQTNSGRMKEYWAEGLRENARYENEYTVGLRGLHDSGLEATGPKEVKAQLVERAMHDQRELLAKSLGARYAATPQVLWLYKESIDLYRTGMKVPDDVTLGWTDDNYGYIRELPNEKEQHRAGGSALYYHVSYWGKPHDYLWLCTTPPALMQEELTKAYEHGVRKLWVLNVGDLKPAEMDIDYFLSLAWDEPKTAEESQHDYLLRWATEQFGGKEADGISEILNKAYTLNFIRKPEFMGFNGYDDAVKNTLFNPQAWGDEGKQRLDAWQGLADRSEAIGARLPAEMLPAYFELVGYPVEAAAAQNVKLLTLDRQLLDLHAGRVAEADEDFKQSIAAFGRIQQLTAVYNSLEQGKWSGMMSAHPRDRHVFDAPVAAVPSTALPASWKAAITGPAPKAKAAFVEINGTVSMTAAHFQSSSDGADGHWRILPELGISGSSLTFGMPGKTRSASWPGKVKPDASTPSVEYRFETTTDDEAVLRVYLLPTFPVDSSTALRYAVQLDDKPVVVLDASGTEQHRSGVTPWEQNVLSNIAVQTVALGRMQPGEHRLRLLYGDAGVVVEHLTVTFPQAVPAYPVAPETLVH